MGKINITDGLEVSSICCIFVKKDMEFLIDEKFEKLKGIYKITNRLNGDFYIGSTVQYFKARFYKYKSLSNILLKTDKKIASILFKAFRKYGFENFVFEILEITNGDLYETRLKEELYIQELKPKYNICQFPTKGGIPNLGRKLSKEWKDNIKTKSSLYKHNEKSLKKVTLNNKNNCTIYEIYKDVLIFTGSAIECSKFLNADITSFYNWLNNRYNSSKDFKIKKVKSQTKTIILIVNDEEIAFNSYSECDKYLNMWRGYTSTMVVRNEPLLKNTYKYKI